MTADQIVFWALVVFFSIAGIVLAVRRVFFRGYSLDDWRDHFEEEAIISATELSGRRSGR